MSELDIGLKKQRTGLGRSCWQGRGGKGAYEHGRHNLLHGRHHTWTVERSMADTVWMRRKKQDGHKYTSGTARLRDKAGSASIACSWSKSEVMGWHTVSKVRPRKMI